MTEIEKHFTIQELAEHLNISIERGRQMVMHEPGVLRIQPNLGKGKKARKTMYRIPSSVLERILQRTAVPVPMPRSGEPSARATR